MNLPVVREPILYTSNGIAHVLQRHNSQNPILILLIKFVQSPSESLSNVGMYDLNWETALASGKAGEGG